MAASITQKFKGSVGGYLKMVIYEITDDNSGGTLEVSLNHILWINAINVDTGAQVALTFTAESESVTFAASTGRVLVTVLGWGG